MSVDPVFAAKERKKLRDRVRRNRAGNSKKKNRAGNSKKKRMRIGPNNTILPIEVSCKWLYLEDKNMLKVTMTQKLEEGTPEYDYLMIMMGDDELLVVFDNVMPQEEFSLLIKSSINQFKNSSEVLDQMRIFKKEEKGAGLNHGHYAEQKAKLTMTKSEFYQYMTSSREQIDKIEVLAEKKTVQFQRLCDGEFNVKQ
jgi:hypothetical protein